MKAWKYYHGEWLVIDHPMIWNVGEDFEIAIEREGYYKFPSMTFGDLYGIKIYTKKNNDDNEFPFLISLCISDYCYTIYIETLPDLMNWLRDYSPLFTLHQMAYVHDELFTLFSRAFQAWHGHDYTVFCYHCDPDAWEARRKRKQSKKEDID